MTPLQKQLEDFYNLPRPADNEYNIVLSFPGHDSCIVISKGTQILEVLELERFFNIKNIDWSRKTQINYPTNTYEKPCNSLFKFYLRQISEYIKHRYPVTFNYCFMLDKNVKVINGEAVDISSFFNFNKLILAHHHTSHALGAFYQSSFEQALCAVYDGGSPDKICCSVFLVSKDKPPKILYLSNESIVKNYANIGLILDDMDYDLERCNFSYPGKIMALSSYGNVDTKMLDNYKNYLNCFCWDETSSDIKLAENLPLAYKNYLETSGTKDTYWFKHVTLKTIKFLKDIGIKNYQDMAPLCDKLWNECYHTNFNSEEKKEFVAFVDRIKGQQAYDIAATIQRALEEKFKEVILPVLNLRQYKHLPIILSGGGALNIILNNKVKEITKREVFVPPDPSDCGLALGAMLSHLRPTTPYSNPYTGFPILDIDSFSSYVAEYGGISRSDNYKIVDNVSLKTESIAKLISKGYVFGVVRGRSERGPRALGNRSILCSGTIPHMKDKLNYRIKFREWYRPFAPLVRLEDVSKYFNWVGESRYMNFCIEVRDEYKKILSSVTHVDGTARVQTITRDQNSFIYDILSDLDKISDVGVMVNTSFNVNGRPIVNTLRDAFYMLDNTELDGIIIEDTLVIKKHSDRNSAG